MLILFLLPLGIAIMPVIFRKSSVRLCCVLILTTVGLWVALNQKHSITRAYPERQVAATNKDYSKGYSAALEFLPPYQVFFISSYLSLAFIALTSKSKKDTQKVSVNSNDKGVAH